MLEVAIVSPVAERFVLRQTAAADRHDLATAKVILRAIAVHNLEVSLNL